MEHEIRPSDLLTYDQVARFFHVAKPTIMRWVAQGRIPSPNYYGVSARFSGEAVLKLKEEGISPAGTHSPAFSPRAQIGRMGPKAKAAKLKKRRARK